MYKSQANSQKDEFQTFRMCVAFRTSFFPKDNFNEMQVFINEYCTKEGC